MQERKKNSNNLAVTVRDDGSSTSKALPVRPSAEERKPETAGSCPYNASPLRGICESN